MIILFIHLSKLTDLRIIKNLLDTKCTGSNGLHDESEYAAVCLVDCCITDEDNVEIKYQLLEKNLWLYKY